MGDAALEAERTAALLRADAVLLFLMWAGALLIWTRLPDPFPVHFDLSGTPDRFVPHNAGGFVLWMFLPAIATITSLVMRWAPRAAVATPHLWNIPRKQDFLALPPDAQAPIQAMLRRLMAAITVLTTGLLLLVEVAFWLAATGSRFAGGFVLIATLLFLAAILVIAVRSTRRISRAIEAASAARATTAT